LVAGFDNGSCRFIKTIVEDGIADNGSIVTTVVVDVVVACNVVVAVPLIAFLGALVFIDPSGFIVKVLFVAVTKVFTVVVKLVIPD